MPAMCHFWRLSPTEWRALSGHDLRRLSEYQNRVEQHAAADAERLREMQTNGRR